MRDDHFEPWPGGWGEPWVSPVGLAKLEARAEGFTEFPEFSAIAEQALDYLRREKMGPPIFGEHWIEVRFLPSEHSIGRSLSFSIGEQLDPETGKPDQGANERRQFNGIGGVAVAPDPSDPLAATIGSRLAAAGVRFVKPGDDENTYMESEGRGWLDRRRHAPPSQRWLNFLPMLFRQSRLAESD